MYSSINDVKNDLKELCIEYVMILEKLKNEEIITEDTFIKCTTSKILFIED
ncbi:hypothetical protein [Romboutsia maritimum]|uniref:hypothetical protein n=1 Tax=Romboutsia maritimum TaxID=2020948 RepID=UPI000BA5C58E|nr:hypothetical protein [Romboutsia maritimum]